MKALVALLALVVTGVVVRAQDAPQSWGRPVTVDRADIGPIEATISRQLDAFRRANGGDAYAETAPNVRRRFPTSAAFMAMARSNYRPLLLSTHITFDSIRSAGATPTQAQTWSQTATVETRDGEAWTATYGLERQPDGTLKITSCVMVKRAAGAA